MSITSRPEKAAIEDAARDTGLAAVLLTLLVAWWRGGTTLLPVAIALLLATILAPWLFAPLAGPWLRLTRLLGDISSRVILCLLFFLLVTPVAVLRRLYGADPMQGRKWKKGAESVLRRREHRYRPEDLANPY